MPSESALVVMVPEAEPLVRPFRARHDPSAAAGVPAHITLLYPFLAPDAVDARVRDGLRALFSGFAPISFALASIRRFPDVLYLAPDPDEPFRQLTLAIWRRYQTPPYGGKWPDIVPHLSVAQIADAAQLDRVADEFAPAAARQLPITADASVVTLLENRSGRWETCEIFDLGPAQVA
jgi:2'-5' RNA ligase